MLASGKMVGSINWPEIWRNCWENVNPTGSRWWGTIGSEQPAHHSSRNSLEKEGGPNSQPTTVLAGWAAGGVAAGGRPYGPLAQLTGAALEEGWAPEGDRMLVRGRRAQWAPGPEHTATKGSPIRASPTPSCTPLRGMRRQGSMGGNATHHQAGRNCSEHQWANSSHDRQRLEKKQCPALCCSQASLPENPSRFRLSGRRNVCQPKDTKCRNASRRYKKVLGKETWKRNTPYFVKRPSYHSIFKPWKTHWNL